MTFVEDCVEEKNETQLSISTKGTFYGKNIKLKIGTCNGSCNEILFNLPNAMRTGRCNCYNYALLMFIAIESKHIPNLSFVGTIVPDLSTYSIHNYYEGRSQYTFCVNSEEICKCYIDPCDSERVFPSFCNNSLSVGLEVDAVENGTIVSIYNISNDGKSNVLLLNIQICKYYSCHFVIFY